jgi:hypothetical protein
MARRSKKIFSLTDTILSTTARKTKVARILTNVVPIKRCKQTSIKRLTTSNSHQFPYIFILRKENIEKRRRRLKRLMYVKNKCRNKTRGIDKIYIKNFNIFILLW